MTDSRSFPANSRVAHINLKCQVVGPQFVDPKRVRVTSETADLLSATGKLDRQLIWGDGFDVLEIHQGVAFGVALRDGYVGYVSELFLGEWHAPTHRVSAPATIGQAEPTLKSRWLETLPMGALLSITGKDGTYLQDANGFYVPARHLTDITQHEQDPVAVAERLLGTPYLWGGNSRQGIDCSGLVQAACIACGIPCPGDSDLQQEQLGEHVPDGTAPQRGDLMFWKGHVGWIENETTLLHANAHHMAVAREDLNMAIARIRDQGDGDVTAHKRIASGATNV